MAVEIEVVEDAQKQAAVQGRGNGWKENAKGNYRQDWVFNIRSQRRLNRVLFFYILVIPSPIMQMTAIWDH